MSSSKGKRITVGIVWGILVAVLMGVLPTILVGYLNDLAGSTVYTLSSNIIILGIAIGALQGSSKATKGSFLQGPLAIVSGGITLGYLYSIFQGGIISVSTVQQGSEISISADITNLLILFMLPPVIGIVKAVIQTAGYKTLREPSEKKSAPAKKADEVVEEASPAEEKPTPAEN